MKKLLVFILALFGANVALAQPYTSRYFHYDQFFDAPAPFKILATTVDGADSEAFQFCSGGACSDTRGAYISAYGNEHASHGRLLFAAGNDAGSGDILFETGGLQHLQIPLSITTAASLAFGTSADSSPSFLIRSNKADAADDGTLQVTAGGAWGTTRGAGIQLLGDDYGGAGAGGGITYEAGTGTTAYHSFLTAGLERWQMDASGNLTQNVTNGADIILRKVSTYVDSATVAKTADIAFNPRFFAWGSTSSFIGGYGANDSSAARIRIYKSRATDGTADTVVSDGDDLGYLWFYGSDGADFQEAGGIKMAVNGTPGAADMPSRMFFYTTPDGSGTAVQRWYIPTGANTVSDWVFGASNVASSIATIRGGRADGSDDGILQLTGGGSDTLSGGRGAYIQLEGEDVGGANSGGNINIVGGVGASSADYPRLEIRNDTADGSDWGRVYIDAGGSSAAGRGAYIVLYGNEAGGTGNLELNAGNVTPGGSIDLITGGSFKMWRVPYAAANTAGALTFGDNIAVAYTATIKSSRDTDGTDDDTLNLCAGGACGTTRGASITLAGDDVGGAGASGGITMEAGTGTLAYTSFIGNGATAKSNLKNVACEEITIAAGSGAAGVASGTNLCASGIIIGVGVRITQAPGGGATTLDVGCTGSGNLDQFIDGISTGLNTTGAYPTNGDGTNTVWVQKTATTMTLTTDGNVTGASLKARVCPYYLDTTAPTS